MEIKAMGDTKEKIYILIAIIWVKFLVAESIKFLIRDVSEL